MKSKIKQYINSLKGKNIHVLGAAGAEGATIIDFLYSHGIKNITGHDFQEDLSSFRHRFKQTHPTLTAPDRAKKLKSIINPDIKLCLKSNYLEGILDSDLIFLISSWYIYPPNFPLIQQALDKNIPVTSMIKLYFDLAPCPIIGITGSQGKSTTTALITKILENSGKKVYTAGNERGMYEQFLDQLENIKKENLIVLEISNRQLTIDLQSSPHVAVITNIHPNHIEEHGSYLAYQKVKKSLFKYQNKSDYAVINYDNPLTKKIAKNLTSNIIPYSTKQLLTNGVSIIPFPNPITSQSNKDKSTSKSLIYFQNKPLLDTSELQLLGEHNLSNILAAIAATSPFNIKRETLINIIKNFPAIPHRLEKVAEIEGVTYIDDLKSSSPTSTQAAILALTAPPLVKPEKIITTNPYSLKPNSYNLFLILGGHHKNVPHHDLAKTINKYVKSLIVLPGTSGNEVIKELKLIKSKVKIIKKDDIFSVISYCQHNTKSGDIVLMSPSAANFQEMHLKNKYSLKSLLNFKTT